MCWIANLKMRVRVPFRAVKMKENLYEIEEKKKKTNKNSI